MSNDYKRITSNAGTNIDGAGLSQSNTVFGDGIIGSRVPTGLGQFFYGIDDRFADSTITNGGSITITGGVGYENLLTVSTSTTPNSSAITQNTEYLRYVPSYEFGMFFTMLANKPNGDGYIKGGLFDGDNGFWIGYKEIDGIQEFGICRVKDGLEYFIKQEEFNIDTLDGNGRSGMVLNPSFGNIYRIRGGYLGFAEILFEIISPKGEIILFHRIEYPNSSFETHVSNTNLLARIEVFNGTTAEDVVAKFGSYCTYVVDGNSADKNNRNFSLGIANLELSAVTSYNRDTIISFRSAKTFQGNLMPTAKPNKIFSLLNFFSLSLNGQNKTGLIELIKISSDNNLTGTFTSKDSGNSTISYSTNATYDFDGSEEVVFSTSFKSTDDIISLLVQELNLILKPGEDMVFAITSSTTLDIDSTFSIAWSELF